jgi:hypothetical protein
MATMPYDPRIRPHLVRALGLDKVEGEVRESVELALAREGRIGDREVLRSWLQEGRPRPLRSAAIRALGRRLEEQDLELFRTMFPLEEELDLNVELAVVLVRNRDPQALQMLRRILWQGDWNESVLAGGLLMRGGGVHSLLVELDSPPAGSDARDLRRVGFALGQWGGIEAVEILARRRAEDDPGMQGAYLGVLSTRTP